MAKELTAQLMRLQEGRERALAKKANQSAWNSKRQAEHIDSQIWRLIDIKADRMIDQEKSIDDRNRHESVANKWRRRAKRAERKERRVAKKAARQYRRSNERNFKSNPIDLGSFSTSSESNI